MKNERGLTLVELLATIVIISIVIMFIVGIQVMIQKQFKTQTRSTEQLTDITIAMKSITNELRLAEEVEIISDGHILIKNSSNGNVEYVLENNILKREQGNYIYDIKLFNAEKKGNNKVLIILESETGKRLETAITLRRD